LPWLYAIARNVKRDWNAKYRPAIESPAEPQKSDHTTLRLIAEQVLARLSEEDRQMLWLSYYEGLSNAEISEYLNIPLTTTKFYLRRAKERARDLLTEYSQPGGHNEA
jgi:RNA polymerase sigma-70 factor (ECF subfamily)